MPENIIQEEFREELAEKLWILARGKKQVSFTAEKLREHYSTEEIATLVDHNLLQEEGRKYELTAAGWREARSAMRRHRLAERLLNDILEVKGAALHETACQFEHHLKKGLDDRVCTLLGHPRVCPHGEEIPDGKCCREGRKEIAQAIVSLRKLSPGQKGHIAYLHVPETKQAQSLLAMGLVPGVRIELLQNFPSYLFALENSQFAVDKVLASSIFIRLED